MALSIKHPDVDQLARDLSKMTGESLTQAVLTALRERLERQSRKQNHKQILADELNRIANRCSRLPILDERSEDEILGYDTAGIPRQDLSS